MTLAAGLDAGLAALRLDLPAAARRKLLDFLDLLAKWNRTYNLTAIRDPQAMLTHHLLDSLAVMTAIGESALAGRRWADVGSGAGLPGIPLAIAEPRLRLTSVEAVDKKAAFQRQARIELDLGNLEVEGRRVEDVPGGGFDAVISRAFAELADFVRLAGHLLAPAGRLYAMKGAPAADETARLPQGWKLIDSLPLEVPGLDARRHLLIVGKD
jgi:16S rRNA (guanine527-N7)-methyltransferase